MRAVPRLIVDIEPEGRPESRLRSAWTFSKFRATKISVRPEFYIDGRLVDSQSDRFLSNRKVCFLGTKISLRSTNVITP